MLRLLTLRHAKSERNTPGKSDFDRPLETRGKDAAARIGQVLRAGGLRPARVLTSPAARARETADGVAAAFAEKPETLPVAGLYKADGAEVMECVRKHGGRSSPLLVVGHNPAIQEFALGLIAGGDGDALGRMRAGYPTAALAVLDADISDWRELDWERCTLTAFTCPGVAD